MDLASLGIRIDVTGAIAAVKQLGAALGQLGSKGTASTNDLTSALGSLSKYLGAGYLAHAFVANTIEAQDAMAQLEAAIKSTGGAAGRSVEELTAYASALQNVSTFSDEAVQGAQSLLLTFGEIKGTNFDAATSAVVDLATRMKGDLQGAAIQVGKALQDPATGLVALKKSGVSFTESQVAVIKKLQETGHIAQAQTMILKELQNEFGGSAEAARDTLGGALAHLKNMFGDVFEVTKSGSASSVAAINGMADAMPAVRKAFEEFITNTIVGYAKISSAIQKVHHLLSWDLTKSWAENSATLKKANAATDEETAALIAMANTTAKASTEVKKHTGNTDDNTASMKANAAAHKKWLELQKEIAHIRTEAVVAADAANAERLKGVQGLQDEEAMQTRLSDALGESTQAYEDQKDMEAIANAVKAAGIKYGDAEYAEAVRAAKAAQDLAKSIDKVNKARSDASDQAEKDKKDLAEMKKNSDELRAAQTEANATYARDMQKEWLKGIADITSHGLTSFSAFFESVNKMFIGMLDKMTKAGKEKGFGGKLLGLGTSAISGGMAGYQIGSSTGSAVAGALGGAASGALAGSAFGAPGMAVGAIAGFVGGIIGAGNAAKEAAKHMAELRTAIATSMEGLRADVAGDTLAGAKASINADRESRRKAIEDAYSGGGSGSDTVRERNKLLAEMNALEDARIAKVVAAHDTALRQMNEDIQVQILRNNGLEKEADALAKSEDQERRFASLRLEGIDEATIAQLKASEAQRDALADIAAATEAAKVKAEEYAAAMAKAAEQQRAVEDINVELMGAKGDTAGAADLQFQLDQQRRLEQAQKEQSAEYVAKLLELQQIQRDQRAADQLIAATAGPSAGDVSSVNRDQQGADSAASAVSASVTERTAYALVDIGRQQLSALLQAVDLLTAIANGSGGGSGTFQDVNAFLGNGTLTSAKYAGSVKV